MDTELSIAPATGTRSRNWWKVGFFVALLAFELAREIAVMEVYSPAQVNASYTFTNVDGWVHASGTWERIDSKEKLVPSVVTIQCDPSTSKCLEVTTPIYERMVMPPELGWFPAKWTADSITYENRLTCVRYKVSIDLKRRTILSERHKEAGATDPNCSIVIEPLIISKLSDSELTGTAELYDEHFFPVMWLIYVIVKGLGG